jgi:hypothetical protein
MSKIEQRENFDGSMLVPSPARFGIYPATESFALPPDLRPSIMSHHHRPPCPKCQATTVLARITPGSPAGFNIRTFECPACNYVHQVVVELIDPMKSEAASGWLHGQLQAPT